MSFYKSCKKRKIKFTELRLDGTENRAFSQYAIVDCEYTDDYAVGSLADIAKESQDMRFGARFYIEHSFDSFSLSAKNALSTCKTFYKRDECNNSSPLDDIYELCATEYLMNNNSGGAYKIYGLGEPLKLYDFKILPNFTKSKITAQDIVDTIAEIEGKILAVGTNSLALLSIKSGGYEIIPTTKEINAKKHEEVFEIFINEYVKKHPELYEITELS